VRINLQTNPAADFRQPIKHIQRNQNLVADAIDVDDDLPGNLVRQSAADVRDHGKFMQWCRAPILRLLVPLEIAWCAASLMVILRKRGIQNSSEFPDAGSR
jgi:hypothetical protein